MARIFNTLPRLATIGGLLLLLAGFVVIVAGLSKLQKTTNGLSGLDSATINAYDTTFSYALLTPYAGSPHWQFAFIWFIIFYHLFCLLFAAAVIALPALGHAGRPAALALFAIATVLVINVVNNLIYLHRNPVTYTVYKKRDVDVTLAGAFLVVLGDFLTLIPLGLWTPEVGTAGYTANNKRAPAETATATTTV